MATDSKTTPKTTKTASSTASAKKKSAKPRIKKTVTPKAPAQSQTSARKSAPAIDAIKLVTSLGDIILQLNAEKAPLTTANFYRYVDDKFYDHTIFHRVINNFMIQGGGMEANMHDKPTHPPIQNEANNGLSNKAYTIAMARTPHPHSASSQFFINVADNDFLNFSAENSQGWGYCVFGQVIAGHAIVDRIKVVKTGSQAGHQDVPTTPVIILKAERVSYTPD